MKYKHIILFLSAFLRIFDNVTDITDVNLLSLLLSAIRIKPRLSSQLNLAAVD